MSKIYQFVVHAVPGRPARTYHTFEVENPLTPAELSRYASHLVAGQLFCSSQWFGISHVTALECELGELFDEKTITHTMLISEPWKQNYANSSAVGLRPGPFLDSLWCANFKRNKVEGRCRVEQLYGVVGYQDRAPNHRQFTHSERIALNMDGTLALMCADWYLMLIEDLEGNDTLFRCDRWGNLALEQENYGLRILSGISNNVRQRSFWAYRSDEARWCDLALDSMRFWMMYSLEEYYFAMNHFDYDWYGGKVPDLTGCIRAMMLASGFWWDFARALGYKISPDLEGQEWISDLVGYSNFTLEEKALRIQNVNDEPLRCFNMLSHCWQFLRDRYYKQYAGIPRYDGSYYINDSEGSQYPSTAGTFYEDFDNITGCIFKAMDCINVLSQIVLPINARKPRPKTKKRTLSYRVEVPDVYNDEPESYTYWYFENVYAAGKGDVNWPLPSNEVLTVLPPVAVYAPPITAPRTTPRDGATAGAGGGNADGRDYFQEGQDFLASAGEVAQEFWERKLRVIDRAIPTFSDFGLDFITPTDSEIPAGPYVPPDR